MGKNNSWFIQGVRLLLGIVFSVFLGMLYWSNLILEQKCIRLEGKLEAIQKDLSSFILSFNKNVSDTKQEKKGSVTSDFLMKKQDYPFRSMQDSVGNNLLKEDPYFVKTLPAQFNSKPFSKGTLKLATIARPENLNPFSDWAQVASWIDQCQGSLATSQFGVYETFVSNFALSIEEVSSDDRPDRIEFIIRLRPDLLWQPLEKAFFSSDVNLSDHFCQKVPVTAYDFKFFFDAVMNAHVDNMSTAAMRQNFVDVESFKVLDPLTFSVIWLNHQVSNVQGRKEFKALYRARILTGSLSPLPCFVYQYFSNGEKICKEDQDVDFYRTSSVWAHNFQHHFANQVIVSCGPWIFEGLTEQEIQFRRNPDFYTPWQVLYERMEVKFLDSTDAIWRAFQAGQIDACALSPESLIELDDFLHSSTYLKQQEQGKQVCRLEYLARQFTYVGWNEKNPLFKSAKVRLALTLAIDRPRLIRQSLFGQGKEISGPFFIASSANDSSIKPWPYDPEEAKRLLMEEGWHENGQGDQILEKEIDGKKVPFRFYLTYYVKNPVTKSSCEFIALCLKKVGIDCLLKGVEIADLSSAFDDKSFDALHLSWVLSNPPEDPEALWHSKGAQQKGSLNAVGFSHSKVDELIDELKYESNFHRRQKLYHTLHHYLHEESPYTFLYTPKATLVYWNHLENIFIPRQRQDLIPGANVEEPNIQRGWMR